MSNDQDPPLLLSSSKANAPSTDNICPLTLQSLYDQHPGNIAILKSFSYLTRSQYEVITKKYLLSFAPLSRNESNDYVIDDLNMDSVSTGSTKCQCTLIPLIAYMQNNITDGMRSNSDANQCPVCQNHPIGSIFNQAGMKFIEMKLGKYIPMVKKNSNKNSCQQDSWNILAFRYGKQSYYLSVDSEPIMGGVDTKLKESMLAQDWIGHKLGMETELSLKIIHKGKVLHPNSSQTPQYISRQLFQISQNDVTSFKKPSLVIMGTRIGTELQSHPRKNIEDTRNTSFSNAGTGRILGHMSFWNVLAILCQWSKTLLGGVLVFVRSFFLGYPPNTSHSTATRNNQRDA